MPEWEPDLNIVPPAWMVVGARVDHDAFGSGTIGRVGAYKDVPTVWVDFDDGQTKALALEFGLAHLQPRKDVERPRWWRFRGRQP